MRPLNCRLVGVALFAMLCVSISAPRFAAAEAAACLSPNSADWPEPSKPYFLIIADTSASMNNIISASSNICGYPNNRAGHLRCALQTAFQNLSGMAEFGLMTYAVGMSGCSGACFQNCSYSDLTTPSTSGCGSYIGSAIPANRTGGNLLVPIGSQGLTPPNLSQLLGWVDNSCEDQQEIFAAGQTPLNGALRDAYRYLSSSWTRPGTTMTFPTPLVAGMERPCRSLNVILIADGDDTCDSAADAVAAASALYNTGFTFGGNTYRVKVYVIDFGPGMGSAGINIAVNGGTSASIIASDSTAVWDAIRSIVLSNIHSEICDNRDNNCDGCTDEGFAHYGNVGQNCCSSDRATCLTLFKGSITEQDPLGDRTLLPCTSATDAAKPASWLCYDPGDRCDNTDNNANGSVDETQLKCGTPLHCPSSETCNGLDDNCDGLIDGPVCNGCVPSVEVCDGCDNDCDGTADEGIASQPCGKASPNNCAGTQMCKPSSSVAIGGCVAGGGWAQCTNNPQNEVCDSVDNDCDGIVDDGVAPVPCLPVGIPGGLVYNSNSQCKMGTKACGSNQCLGFIGPSAEVCDGIDNNCDGIIDNNPAGINVPCGFDVPPCTPGYVACVNGALRCSGENGPKPEVCDGIDNNCNGQIDEGQLADAPSPSQNGCWTLPGNCCSYVDFLTGVITNWCPPPGATCSGNGALTSPCNAGVLACGGPYGWVCAGPKVPSPETCDGFDNNCNGAVDDGSPSPVGQVCGFDVGECQTGVLQCSNGAIDCVGDIAPQLETCDGLDNDCDGIPDNNMGTLGYPCVAPYDTNLFPGPRTGGACQLGVTLCDASGKLLCVEGVSPQTEICDGIDNDCDGTVDEVGPAPNGIDGSKVNADANLGDLCGPSTGVCVGAVWVCQNGAPVCNAKPLQERCDGIDNDCDGATDEVAADNEPVLCGPGTECIRQNQFVLCSQPCQETLPRCPSTQDCVDTLASSDSSARPNMCLPHDLVVAPPPKSGLALPVSQSLAGKANVAALSPSIKLDAHARLQAVDAFAKLAEPAETTAAKTSTTEATEATEAIEAPIAADPQTEATGGCSTSASPTSCPGGMASLLLMTLAALWMVARKRKLAGACLVVLALFAVSCSTNPETSTAPWKFR